MSQPGRARQTPADPAAESRAFGPSFGCLVLALLVVAGGIAYGVSAPDEPAPVAHTAAAPRMTVRDPAPAEPLPDEPAAAASSPASIAPQQAASREPDGDPTPDLRAYLNAGEKPGMAEVLDRLHRAGVYTGIGAFSPPGTKPTLIGLAVPEDFVLPEGYVRHYQATDDGQPIEPILMYSPDRPLLDAAGQAISMPKNRVVPPELAPPGLPQRRIVIPAPVEPDKPGT